jgi:pyruvate-formate lyase
MYLKELYKTRTVEKYEGYDTVYNNESRIKLPELIDHMERFTETYKITLDAHPAIREAACFDAQFPAMMLGIASNDRFVGRADLFPLGFNAQYINGAWGFVMETSWFLARFEDPEVTEEQKQRLRAIYEFWGDKTSMGRFRATMDEESALYLVNGGVVGKNAISGYGRPNAALAGSRVAGVFLDFDKLLEYGLSGLIELTKEKEKTSEKHNPEFFEGIRRSIGTIQRTLLWYADLADEMAQQDEEVFRKDDLEQMAYICRKLTTEKPETFRECIQLVLIYAIMDGAREWGRMDDYLANYYVNDLEQGVLTEEEALDLLKSFWRLMIVKEQVTDDRIIIGGLGRKNPENADKLALLMIETSRQVKDIVPQLTLRMYEGMNPELYDKALDCIGEGTTFPMLYQDENIIPGIQRVFHISYEEALDWMPLGCGEYTINHRIIASPNGTMNLANVVLATMNSGYELTDTFRLAPNNTSLKDYATFEDLFQTYCDNVDFLMEITAKNHARGYEIIAEDMALNLHSVLYDGCLEKGVGILDGGSPKLAGSNEIYGLVTASDSLYAIKKLVFNDKVISPETMMAALKANFVGYEKERAMMLNVDKYGNDLEEVDDMMARVHEQVSYSALAQAGKFDKLDEYGMVSINNSYNTLLGHQTHATPNGRVAGDSLSNGNNPTAGMDKNGMTAFLNSLLRARTDIHYGVVQNMKFSKETFNDMRETVAKPALDSYFARGGAQAMISVVGREDLEKARIRPEKYTNLIVRVGGFSARYIELDDDIQIDILNRTLN